MFQFQFRQLKGDVSPFFFTASHFDSWRITAVFFFPSWGRILLNTSECDVELLCLSNEVQPNTTSVTLKGWADDAALSTTLVSYLAIRTDATDVEHHSNVSVVTDGRHRHDSFQRTTNGLIQKWKYIFCKVPSDNSDRNQQHKLAAVLLDLLLHWCCRHSVGATLKFRRQNTANGTFK